MDPNGNHPSLWLSIWVYPYNWDDLKGPVDGERNASLGLPYTCPRKSELQWGFKRQQKDIERIMQPWRLRNITKGDGWWLVFQTLFVWDERFQCLKFTNLGYPRMVAANWLDQSLPLIFWRIWRWKHPQTIFLVYLKADVTWIDWNPKPKAQWFSCVPVASYSLLPQP